MRKHLPLFPFMFFLATPALAKPTCLDCLMTYPGDPPRHWQITFDEEQGTMSWSSDNGRAGKLSAVITALQITGIANAGSGLTRQWTINRFTGAATDTLTAGFEPVTATGVCKPMKVDRQF